MKPKHREIVEKLIVHASDAGQRMALTAMLADHDAALRALAPVVSVLREWKRDADSASWKPSIVLGDTEAAAVLAAAGEELR